MARMFTTNFNCILAKKSPFCYNVGKGGVRQFGAKYIAGGNPVW